MAAQILVRGTETDQLVLLGARSTAISICKTGVNASPGIVSSASNLPRDTLTLLTLRDPPRHRTPRSGCASVSRLPARSRPCYATARSPRRRRRTGRRHGRLPLLVTPIPAIVARDPRTGGAIDKAPIAEVEAAFDRAEIGLGAWRQSPARVLGIQISVQHAARHVSVSSRPHTAFKPLYAQRIPNIRRPMPADKRGLLRTLLLI